MSVALSLAAQRFGRYQLLEYLGSGGMSDVFVAIHTGLRKRVALKLLRPSLRDDKASVERFLREGQCAARVSHPNVVDVTDVGVERDIPYLVMEYLAGETLEQRLRREGPLSAQAAVELILPIAEGVAAIHRAGVLHRDIKPANILLARTHDGALVPKLVDFGIATVEERRSITGMLGPMGTPHYMSPEQARGVPQLDERSDQYSLAGVLFEMLTGRAPFEGSDVLTVISRAARGCFPRAYAANKSVPRALDDVLQRATLYDPIRRFASVSEFGEALRPFGTSLAARKRSRRWRAATTAAAAFGLAIGLFVGVSQQRASDSVPVLPIARAVSNNAQRVAAAQARKAQPPAHVTQTITLSPPEAEGLLDGHSLGHDAVVLPHLDDGRVHELRVSAPGYVPRIVLFRRTLDVQRIALEPQHQALLSRAH